MRLGRKKRIYITNRVDKKRVSGVLSILFVLFLFVFFSIYFFNSMRPILIELTSSKATVLATDAINMAVNEVFSQKKVSCNDILTFTNLEDGTVSAVKTNTENVNLLRSAIAISVADKISALDKTVMRLPIGALLGNDIFSGMGPDLRFDLMPYGYTFVDFESEFSEAGINQTRVSIDLNVKTTVGLLMPTVRKTKQVETKIPVASAVIVGKIPSNYVNVDREGYEYEDDILQLAEE